MIAAFAGLVLPIGAAWWGLRALGLRRTSDSAAVTAAVACGSGLVLASLGAFAALVLGGRLSSAYAAADATAWLALGTAAWWACRRREGASRPPREEARLPLESLDWVIRGVFAAVALCALAVPVIEYWASPHGQWDAWAIWNQKARFMFRGGPGWAAFMAIPWSAPSHPMFVSLSVARLWAYAGGELTIVPATLSIVYGTALVALVVGALDPRTRRAWVAGSVLVAPFTVSHLVAAQTADLPLALFLTASLVVLREWLRDGGSESRSLRTIGLVGLLGSCAAWTKNEGFVFLAASGAVVAWGALRRRRLGGAALWLAAALPLTALVIWFKLSFPVGSPEYFTEQQGGPSALQRATDPDRLWLVGAMTAPFWWRWGGTMTAGALIVTTLTALGAAASRDTRVNWALLWVVFMMVAGYYAVWVLSPLDTAWLVGTTFDRLFAQLWPTLVIVAASVGETDFMLARQTT